MTEKQVYIPNLKWYQDKDYVYLDIDAYNAVDFNLKIKDNNLNYSFVSNNNYYEMKFELFDNADHVKYIDCKSSIKITLQKKNKEYWRNLTFEKNLYKNYIKLDWNKWIDEDSEEENNNFDFSNMMKNMGGMMNNNNGNAPFDFKQMMESMNTEENDEENLEEIDEDEEPENYCDTCISND
jgi:prostaglandin-E synthase